MELLPPPDNKVYSSLKSLIDDINTHAAQQGYAVIKERTKQGKDGTVNVAYLRCDERGGGLGGAMEDTGGRIVHTTADRGRGGRARGRGNRGGRARGGGRNKRSGIAAEPVQPIQPAAGGAFINFQL